MDIAVIGPPGAGKGTHTKNLMRAFGLHYVSTGELLRENLENKTGLGFMAQSYRESGEIVPNEVIDAMIVDFLGKVSSDTPLLFNGFPRSVYQAQFLDTLFGQTGRSLNAVIFLKTSDEEIERRLSDRLICSSCQAPFHRRFNPFHDCPYDRCSGEYLYHRKDDSPEMVRGRLDYFYRNVAPIVRYFQQTERLFIIDGEGELDEVDNKIIEVVAAVQQQKATPATPEDIAQIRDLKSTAPIFATEQLIRPTLDIIFLGAPGAGKGTQAEAASDQFNIERIATGDIFRQNIRNETELGKIAKGYIDHGKLVPDNVTESMVRDRLSKPDVEQGFILDGFPRNLPQAEALTAILASQNRRLAGVIYLRVDDEEIITRLSGRMLCHECQHPFHKTFNPFQRCPENKCNGEHLYQRDDDKPETVKARLAIFHGETEPLVDYYRQANLLIEINGEGDLERIQKQVFAAIEALQTLQPESQ